jgi:hypothetical protein
MTAHVIEIRLISGEHNGKNAFIPSISISPSVKQIAFAMKCRQFPIHLAFPMSINKSQSMDHIRLTLRSDFFAHGQLYVALSPCPSSQRVKALFKKMPAWPKKYCPPRGSALSMICTDFSQLVQKSN